MRGNMVRNGTWPEHKKHAHPLVQPFWDVRYDLHTVEDIVMKENKIVTPLNMRHYILSVITHLTYLLKN